MGQADRIHLGVAGDDGVAVVRQADEAGHLASVRQGDSMGVEALAADVAGVEEIVRISTKCSRGI